MYRCVRYASMRMTIMLTRLIITKLIYTHFLNRINTVTGMRYGDDPTILAWETGNELQHSFIGKLPAPGAWTGQTLRLAIEKLD